MCVSLDRSQSVGVVKTRPVSLVLPKRLSDRESPAGAIMPTTLVKVTSQDSIGNCSLNVHAEVERNPSGVAGITSVAMKHATLN
ncbi:unnamed protein product [Notodromas monacha]|uniref:Uncharacterized protein n=1 Tax=Notodromas monacha TaxID=399045 RepID=A0A7R9BLT7_9CRUS|nr:unnamed protein product [Notodromas monacha]CAG0916991.1 unnamed protein product [Notodromas monacha]